SSPLLLIADGFAALFRPIADTLDGSDRFDEFGWKRRLVAMSACGPDRMRCGQNARPFRDASVDGIAQPHIEELVCAHIPDGLESGRGGAPAVQPRVVSMFAGEAEDALVEAVVIILRKLRCQMNVRVNESGQNGRISQIDHLCPRWYRSVTNRDDPVAG